MAYLDDIKALPDNFSNFANKVKTLLLKQKKYTAAHESLSFEDAQWRKFDEEALELIKESILLFTQTFEMLTMDTYGRAEDGYQDRLKQNKFSEDDYRMAFIEFVIALEDIEALREKYKEPIE